MSAWHTILTAEEIVERHALTSTLDPSFAKSQREFWESRTDSDLRVLAAQAWDCNESDQYQLARSYAALRAA